MRRGLASHPARQRPPLLPILLRPRARQIEDRQSIARAMDVHLRIAQVRNQGKLKFLQEIVQLGGGACTRVDAHRDDTQRKLALLHRLVFGERAEKALRRRHVERRCRQRHEHHVGPAHRIAQTLAVCAGRRECTTAMGRERTAIRLISPQAVRQPVR